ncbi:hypothetical protein K491DRAFT_614025, partial [Lophiostoma macrostomum CBS 122681]
MTPPNKVQLYKKHTSNTVNFLYDNCEQILGRTEWSSTIGTLPEGPTYKLPVRVFIRSAEIIANTKPLPIPITYSVLQDVKDAIRLRASESSTGQILALQSERMKMIYDTHLHFIEILRKVQRLLETRASQNDHRTLYTGHQYDQEETPEPTRNSAQDEDEITVDNLDSNSSVEFYFLLNCYLLDCEEIRNHCGIVWEQYAKHKVTLMTASNSTNVAYGLLKIRTAQFVLESGGLETNLVAHPAGIARQTRALWYIREHWRSKYPGVNRSIANSQFKAIADMFLSFWIMQGSAEQGDPEVLRDTAGPPIMSGTSTTKDRAVLADRFQRKALIAGFLLGEFMRLSK